MLISKTTQRLVIGLFLCFACMVSLVPLMQARSVQAAPPGGGTVALNLTVTNTQIGITQQMVGAVEGDGGFAVADMTELGINNYRMYGGASRYEPVDDDGVFGSPTIAQIKANPNVINWAAWDTQFNRSDGYFWSLYGAAEQVSSATMLTELENANIKVVMTVRPQDNNSTPAWMPAVPIATEAERNEWWEHVFATVYYINVTKGWNVDHWEIHNEPNQTGQGWADNGGTKEEYAEFAILTADAINYVYATYLGNRPRFIHAPTLSGNPNRSQWSPYLLDTIDSTFNVFDYHWYGSNQGDQAAGYHADIAAHNPDGVIEPIFNSEWGTYRDSYNTQANAMSFSNQLYQMNQPSTYAMGSQVFSLYPWGSAFDGLITTTGAKTETFWAFKTLIPAMQGGKANYNVTTSAATSLNILGTKGADGKVYIAVINNTGTTYNITANVGAHVSSGTAKVIEYSATNKAVQVAAPNVSGGQLTFTSNTGSILRVEITSGGAPQPTATPIPPTPTPAAGGVMHVSNIAMSVVSAGGPSYKAQAVVTVVDANGVPVSGATVTGTYSGATSSTVSGTTAANGTVTLQSTKKSGGGTWTFCVTTITKAGWTYNSAANTETCDTVTGP